MTVLWQELDVGDRPAGEKGGLATMSPASDRKGRERAKEGEGCWGVRLAKSWRRWGSLRPPSGDKPKEQAKRAGEPVPVPLPELKRARPAMRVALSMLALAILAVPLIGCSDDNPETIEATLVSPPNVPPRVDRPAAHVVVHLEALEEVREIAPGVEYRVWTFNGSIPGPMIRVKVGDTVEIRLHNRSDSTMLHNVDLHAVNGPGGGAEATKVAPGEEKAFTFKAKAPGLFVYHCAAGIVADHIANGMYGAILVDGVGARQSVDHEYYVGQHEFYLTDEAGAGGLPTLDSTKLLDEQPTYVVFNGKTNALVGDDALEARTGETVRLYVANGGPNLISSFHVIGEIFDRAYEYGSTSNLPIRDIQTLLVPPGGAGIVDFRVDVPGDYKLVDHAISRVSKGGLGILRVTGDADPETFNDLGAAPASDSTATPTGEATQAPQPTATKEPSGEARQIAIEMKDNLFEPREVTVRAGSQIVFQLRNVGAAPHNMHIAESGSFEGGAISQPDLILPNKSGELTWEAPNEPGTYEFRCDIHPVDMTGVIIVEE